MTFQVSFSEDAAAVLRDVSGFLEGRPVEHNLILTLLLQRAGSGEPGRYWVVRDGDGPVGVVLQSPIGFRAAITPMARNATRAAVDAIAAMGVALPGVEGEAGAAAAFAGHWAERCRTGARPVVGTRLQLLGRLVLPVGVEGGLRRAGGPDLPLVLAWSARFAEFVGDRPPPEEVIARRVASGEIALWEAGGAPASMAGHTVVAGGVCRIGPVFTPPPLRRRGYTAGCVGQLSAEMVDAGASCILYTDLNNPTSNSVYRSLGYVTVSENLRYEFDGAGLLQT